MKVIRHTRKFLENFKNISALASDVEQNKILIGKLISNLNIEKGLLANIHDAEFKVFSQYGEDGIIQYLIHQVKIQPNETTFIEFGAQNYSESNTKFLLENNNWKGLIIDGSEQNIKHCQSRDLYWRHDLTAVNHFIDANNINEIFETSNFTGDIGLLSIDIDGNDYWVWESIKVINPVIVICEYNSLFGSKEAVSIPYIPDFVRSDAHHSNLYFGCSLKALELLAKIKGYSLVGCTSVGNNAFFVRNDRLNNLQNLKSEDAYVESRFRESRDENGNLTFISGASRLDIIGEMLVENVVNGASIRVKDIAL